MTTEEIHKLLVDMFGGEKIVDGDDIPKRGIHGVVFRPIPPIGKQVGQHAFGDYAGPLEQDVAGMVETAGSQAKSTEGNKRIAAPIGEPGVAGHDGLAFAAPDQITLRSPIEGSGERGASVNLARAKFGE